MIFRSQIHGDLRRLPRARALDLAVQGAIALLEEAHGGLRVGELASRIGVSRQHLARRFRVQVGVSPKVLARVLRLQDLLRRASGETRPDWAQLALAAGYCDQAHLIDEFKALTGATPGGYFAS